jgi:group I intron endonuclease
MSTTNQNIQWEEKNSIEPKKNCLSNTAIDPNAIIKDTNKNSMKSQCNDTGKISGIYKIVNKVNSKYYVGSSNNILKRWNNHKSNLRRKIHKSPHLQSAWNKYGELNFDFIIVENCDIDKLLIIEQKYLDVSILEKNICYNTLYMAERPMTGIKHSDKTKNKISKSVNNYYQKGYSSWNKGKCLSQTHRDKISETRIMKQIKPSDRQRLLQSKMVKGENNYFYGKHLTGSKNGRYIDTKLEFYNQHTHECFIGSRHEFINKFNLCGGNVCNLIKRKIRHVKGWEFVKEHQ